MAIKQHSPLTVDTLKASLRSTPIRVYTAHRSMRHISRRSIDKISKSGAGLWAIRAGKRTWNLADAGITNTGENGYNDHQTFLTKGEAQAFLDDRSAP